jgi:elongation factor P
MTNIRANKARKGNILILDGELFVVTSHEFRKPGKGSSFNQIKLKHHSTGAQKALRLSSDETLELAYLDRRQATYSYKEGENYVFMDCENYEQYFLTPSLVDEAMPYVRENQQVGVTLYEGNPLTVELPTTVVLQITEAEIGARGDTVTNDKVKAVAETGLELKVPPYITTGEYVKISTETGEFQARAKAEDQE